MAGLPFNRPEGLFSLSPPFHDWQSSPMQDSNRFASSPTLMESSSAPNTIGRGEKVSRAAIASEIAKLKERLDSVEHNNSELRKAMHDWKLESRKMNEKCKKEMDDLKTEVVSVTAARADGAESSEESEREIDPEMEVKLELSTAHANSNIFKSLIRSTFSEALGCPGKLTPEFLPPWPTDEAQWPTKPGTGLKLMRFHWDKPHTDPENWKNIIKLRNEIQQNGVQIIPAAAEAIKFVSREDLDARLIQKFKDLCKAVRSSTKATVEDTEGAETAGGEMLALVRSAVLAKSVKQSRAKGKIEVRRRKWESLIAGHELKDEKFRPALTATLMSDDEDCFGNDGVLIPGKFISRAPIYRTQILNNFFDELDKIPDPRPSTKYVPRVRGEPKDVPPPSSTLLKNKARRWMVRSEWLALDENRDFDVPARIVDSGRLWGDPADPEETEGKQKRVKEEKEEIKRKKVKLEEIAGRSKKPTKNKAKRGTTVRARGTKNSVDPSRAKDDDEMSSTTNEDK